MHIFNTMEMSVIVSTIIVKSEEILGPDSNLANLSTTCSLSAIYVQ